MARGDHIYVNRVGGIYNHHGIDCGDDSVIHYTSKTERILNDASNRVNRLLDGLRGLRVAELDFTDDGVIKRAESRLGESRFQLVSNNCEHFSAWCKTGISSSNQITSIWKASLTGPKFMRRRTQHMLTELFESPWSR